LYELKKNIVPYFIKHNAETDAIDLLMEANRILIILNVIFLEKIII